DSGAIAGWTMISNALYKLDSGTPTSTPNNGITIQTVGGTNSKPVIKVYDGTTMNAALGNYASGKYGIYAQEGSIGGWTINATDIYNTHMGMESDNERLWIHNSTFANAGIQLEYNGGSPRAHIGNGSTEYFKYTGSALDILTGGGALRFNSVGFQFKLGGLYTGDGASGIGVVWKTVFDDVTPANEKTQGYIRMVPQISPNKPYLELVSGSADNNYYCNIAMRTVTDSGTRTPIFIDGDAQRVSIYDTTPADATFSVLNPGNNEPTCSFQQIASDKAVLHLKHTHANVYYFNFEGGHTDRDGYNAVRVYLQGVGTRWIRLYDTDD
ncbi:MAG: hypothetical protein PHG80_11870, partial [Methanoregulaceae archaeon]|nr:hypothetical protein [Methanoregulaceae archaeon]